MAIHDLKDYKRSKMYVDDLKVITHVLALTIKSLEFFSVYLVVGKILLFLKSEQEIIKGQLKKAKETIDNKGIIR